MVTPLFALDGDDGSDDGGESFLLTGCNSKFKVRDEINVALDIQGKPELLGVSTEFTIKYCVILFKNILTVLLKIL